MADDADAADKHADSPLVSESGYKPLTKLTNPLGLSACQRLLAEPPRSRNDPRLTYAAVRTPPMPYRLLILTE